MTGKSGCKSSAGNLRFDEDLLLQTDSILGAHLASLRHLNYFNIHLQNKISFKSQNSEALSIVPCLSFFFFFYRNRQRRGSKKLGKKKNRKKISKQHTNK